MALEKGEVDETVTLASLRRAAEALDCQLVYVMAVSYTHLTLPTSDLA